MKRLVAIGIFATVMAGFLVSGQQAAEKLEPEPSMPVKPVAEKLGPEPTLIATPDTLA